MKKETIGWIGTGHMGNPMCGHLLDSGYNVLVHTRTKSKADNLLNGGARWMDSVKELTEKSDIIFSIVCGPKELREIVYGDRGILSVDVSGKIFIDMTTSLPILAEKIFGDSSKRGMNVLDAPVSGGPFGAKDGTLAVMAGGDKATFDKILPIFSCFGKTLKFMGSSGSGQKMKLCNQILLLETMVGLVESLLFAQKIGLDQKDVVEILNSGVNGSPMVLNQGMKIADGDHTPGISTLNFMKDIEIALGEARRVNLSFPSLSLLHQFYIAAVQSGLGNIGSNASLYEVLGRLNSMESKFNLV